MTENDEISIFYVGKRTFKREYYVTTTMESPTPQKNQPTSIDSLRAAFVRVLKRRRVHDDFLRVSRETEERLSEDRPSTMFFYGL